MTVDGSSIRGFLANFTDVCTSDVDLDQLVIQYRLTNDSKLYATIYNKVLGTVLRFGRKCPGDLGLDEDDVCAYGMNTLYRTLDPIKGWKSDTNVKFITYFYRAISNEFITQCNKKCNRDYKKFMVSLDDLLSNEDDEELVSKFQPTEIDTCSKYIKGKRETYLEAVSILGNQLEDDNISSLLSLELGISKVGLKLALFAARIKAKIATEEEKTFFSQNKKIYNETRKQLKLLV